MICKDCYMNGKGWPMKREKWGANLYFFNCTNPNHVRGFWAELTPQGWQYCSIKKPSNKATRLVNTAGVAGKDISYFDGSKQRTISKEMLKHIKSTVTTHEGETLNGKEGRKYLDEHSKKMLGKNLAGSYNDETMDAYVK